MLVLSRRPGQSLRIGDEVRLVIVRIEKGRVRVGIDAPSHVPIAREELDPLFLPHMAAEDDKAVRAPWQTR